MFENGERMNFRVGVGVANHRENGDADDIREVVTDSAWFSWIREVYEVLK